MARISALAFSPDGAALAFTGSSEDVTVWDFAQIRSRLGALGLGWDPASVPDPPATAVAWTPAPDLATPPPVRPAAPAPRAPPAPIPTAHRPAEGKSAQAWRWIEQAPENHNAWVGAASLLARVGDRDGYDRHRRRLLAKYGATLDPTIAERTAKACLLLPGDGAVTAEAARLAGLAVAGADQVPSFANYFLLADGLARYRLGRFEAAEGRVRTAIEAGEDVQGWNMTVPALYVRAMALSRLGRTGEARAALARGAAIQDGLGAPGPIGDHPLATHDTRACQVLRREAEAVVLLDPAFPADPFAK